MANFLINRSNNFGTIVISHEKYDSKNNGKTEFITDPQHQNCVPVRQQKIDLVCVIFTQLVGLSLIL